MESVNIEVLIVNEKAFSNSSVSVIQCVHIESKNGEKLVKIAKLTLAHQVINCTRVLLSLATGL